jgi:hypothetical protein
MMKGSEEASSGKEKDNFVKNVAEQENRVFPEHFDRTPQPAQSPGVSCIVYRA